VTERGILPGLWPIHGDGVLARQGNLVLLIDPAGGPFTDRLLDLLADAARTRASGLGFTDRVSAEFDADAAAADTAVGAAGPAVVAFGPVGPAGGGTAVALYGTAWAEVTTAYGVQRLATGEPYGRLRCVLPSQLISVRAGVQPVAGDAGTDPYLRLADGVVRAIALVYAPAEVGAAVGGAPGATPGRGGAADLSPAWLRAAGQPSADSSGPGWAHDQAQRAQQAAQPAPPAPTPPAPAPPVPAPPAPPVPAAPGPEGPGLYGGPLAEAEPDEYDPTRIEPAVPVRPAAPRAPRPAAYQPPPPAPQPAAYQPPPPAPQPAAYQPPPPAPQPAAPRPPTPAPQPAAYQPPTPAPQPAAYQPPTPEPQPVPVPPRPVAEPPGGAPQQDFISLSLAAGVAATELPQRDPLPLGAEPPQPEDLGLVEAPAAEVEGVYCKNGHFNDPEGRFCAVCGISMAQQTKIRQKGKRPPLGVLVLGDGSVCQLDADYVIGREPTLDSAVANGQARPLRLSGASGVVSRTHARVELDGWQVFISDLNSANGTQVLLPGERNPINVQPGTRTPLVPGAQIRLGGEYGLQYDSHRHR
jgi:hypothetical protein